MVEVPEQIVVDIGLAGKGDFDLPMPAEGLARAEILIEIASRVMVSARRHTMGFLFRKRIKILPGIWFNLSKRGISTSIGGKGITINIKDNKTRTTASLPGTGLSYRTTSTSTPSTRIGISVWVWVLIIAVIVVLLIVK